MKLYTEEQVRIAIQQARIYEDYWHMEYQYTDDDIIKELTAIELPTEEEIEQSSKYWNETTNPDIWTFKLCWKAGAKWVIEQIKKHK